MKKLNIKLVDSDFDLMKQRVERDGLSFEYNKDKYSIVSPEEGVIANVSLSGSLNVCNSRYDNGLLIKELKQISDTFVDQYTYYLPLGIINKNGSNQYYFYTIDNIDDKLSFKIKVSNSKRWYLEKDNQMLSKEVCTLLNSQPLDIALGLLNLVKCVQGKENQ